MRFNATARVSWASLDSAPRDMPPVQNLLQTHHKTTRQQALLLLLDGVRYSMYGFNSSPLV